MKNPVNIILIAVIILLLGYTVFKNSSSTDSSPAAAPLNAEGYSVKDIENTSVKKLEKYGENNILLESGETLDGVKTGTWATYYSDGRVKSINSYLAGKLNGVQMTFTDRGYVEMQAIYKDGVLNGN